jgi:putative transposase
MAQTYAPRRSAEQWQSLIEQYQSSGQSARQFCQEQSLGYTSFCQWRKRLSRTEDKIVSIPSIPSIPSDATKPSFIDLTSLGAPQAGGWHLVLHLGGGVELTLSQG